MGKVLLLLSFLSLIILILGKALVPNSEILLLASGSGIYQHVRELVASIVFLQFISPPPRHIVFRVLSGIVALSVGSWAIESTLNGLMPFLDTFSLLASASAISVAALEVRPVNKFTNNANPLIA